MEDKLFFGLTASTKKALSLLESSDSGNESNTGLLMSNADLLLRNLVVLQVFSDIVRDLICKRRISIGNHSRIDSQSDDEHT